MNPIENPYRPGAGTKPTFLAGRDEIINKGNILLKRVKIGNPQRSLMLYGLRGVGKTVLLNKISELAEAEHYIVEQIEMSENDDFRRVIASFIRKILLKINRFENAKEKLLRALGVFKAFSITIPDGPEFKINVDAISGEADSGDFETDLTDLFVNIGQAAKEEGKCICILIDETQYLKEKDMAALIAACHKISQKELPLVVICAGLPSIAALSGDAKSYAERLFEFLPIKYLEAPQDSLAITEPAKLKNVEYENEAVIESISITKGYPYFIQELGKNSWDLATNSPIKLEDVKNARTLTLKELDNSFFKVRLDRAAGREKKLMYAMADLGQGPYLMSDVAKKVGIKVSSLSPTRATLISKGFIYTPEFGYIDFTVPLFDDFLRRNP
jgi:hypothetical protein